MHSEICTTVRGEITPTLEVTLVDIAAVTEQKNYSFAGLNWVLFVHSWRTEEMENIVLGCLITQTKH